VLIRGLAISPVVTSILDRALGERSRDQALEAYRNGDGRELFGWYSEATLVCVAGLSVSGTKAELRHIATDPAHERQGHAVALVRALIGGLKLDTLVADTDEDAVGFYRRMGFDVTVLESPWPTPRFRCTLQRF